MIPQPPSTTRQSHESGKPSSPFPLREITVGDPLPTLTKQIRLPDMMSYGAATYDFARIHYDAPYAQCQGLPGPVVDGQMLGAFLVQLVQDWAGPKAFLQSLTFQNRGMVLPGDTLTCGGQVIAISEKEGKNLVDCDLWIDNQRGERVVGSASATVSIPFEADSR